MSTYPAAAVVVASPLKVHAAGYAPVPSTNYCTCCMNLSSKCTMNCVDALPVAIRVIAAVVYFATYCLIEVSPVQAQLVLLVELLTLS